MRAGLETGRRFGLADRPGFWGAIALYVGLRAAILATNFDCVVLSMYEQYPMGTIAKMVLDGAALPLSFVYDNSGGQLLVGLAAVPLFALLGPSYLVLKLLPFGLGLLALIACWQLLDRLFGRTEANLSGFLFALAPTTFVKFSVLAFGNHFENVVATALCLWAFFALHGQSSFPFQARRVFWVWFLIGAALFVFLGFITTLGLFAICHVGLRGIRQSPRELACAAGGFLLGSLPLWLLNAMTGRGAIFLRAKFRGEPTSPTQLLQRFLDFFTEHLPKAPVFEDLGPLEGSTANAVFLTCSAIAYAALLPSALRGALEHFRNAFHSPRAPSRDRTRRSLALLLVLYMPLTGIAFGLSDLTIGDYGPPVVSGGYRYFLPHFMLTILMLSIVAARGLRSARRPSRLAGGALAGTALACGLFNLSLIEPSLDKAELGLRYEGYDFHAAARPLVSRRNNLSPQEMAARAGRFPMPLRRRTYEGIGFYRCFFQSLRTPEPTRVEVAAVLADLPLEHARDIACGIGLYLRMLWIWDPGREAAVLAALGDWQASGEEHLESIAEGICQSFEFLPNHGVPDHMDRNQRWLASGPEPVRGLLARGHGVFCGRLVRRGIRNEQVLVASSIAALPAQALEPFIQGFGFGLADGREPGAWSSDLDALVPQDLRELARSSYEERLAQLGAQQ
jgi:hypothetical protein